MVKGMDFNPEGESLYNVKAAALFKKADKNRDGVLDAEELKEINSVFGKNAFKVGITFEQFTDKIPSLVENNDKLATTLADLPDEKEESTKIADIK